MQNGQRFEGGHQIACPPQDAQRINHTAIDFRVAAQSEDVSKK
jgi:hypothetical protein